MVNEGRTAETKHSGNEVFATKFNMNTEESADLNIDRINFESASFEILSTIRYDPLIVNKAPKSPLELTPRVFFLWDLHMRRLQVTLDYFHHIEPEKVKSQHKLSAKDSQVTLDEASFEVNGDFILQQIKDAFVEANVSVEKPLKIRLLTSLDGEVKIELHPTPERPNLMLGLSENYPKELRYDIYVDKTPVYISPFTSFKTTKRDVYNDARKRALPGKSALEEVLLINSSNELMEGSIFNVAAELVDGSLVTPPLRSGCLCGVTRCMLIGKGIISEDTILLDDLKIGHEILLFNGIVGVAKGIIRGFVEEKQ